MQLIRFGKPNQEHPGILMPDGRQIDATGFGSDYDEAFFADNGLSRLRTWVECAGAEAPTISEDVRLGPPICRPSKIICIGLNYRDHVEESGMDMPTEPVVFFKATSSLCGPNDDLIIPRGGDKTDWEVELAVVIAKRALYIDESDALDHVAGYALFNDYSERAFQLEREGQWVKGKSCDTFSPLGPTLVTPDEIENVHNLNMWLRVNGETRQQSNTSNMVFGIPHLISYISQFMTLLPGDVISTGTPPGVGLGMDPPQYLAAGDKIELGIDGLGTSRQRAVIHRSS